MMDGQFGDGIFVGIGCGGGVWSCYGEGVGVIERELDVVCVIGVLCMMW